MKSLDRPQFIMINVPEAFFRHDGKVKGSDEREKMFRQHYETMGTDLNPDGTFYHFISTVPVHHKDITNVFVCFGGMVQYKAIAVGFLKNQEVHIGDYHHEIPRDWVITTGPAVKAPAGMIQKGFRGFRYCEMLF